MVTYVLIAAILVLYSLGSWVPGLAGQAIERSLKRQFGPFQRLTVTVETEPPIRAVTGQVDGVHLEAAGFKVRGVPIAGLQVITDPFHLNPMVLMGGGIPRLEAPVGATTSIDLSNDTLDAVLHSEAVLKPLRNIPIRLGGFGGLFGPQSVDVVPGHARILAGAIAVDGTVDFGGTDVPFTAMATPQLVGDNQIALINLSATVYGSPIPPSMLAQAAQQTRLTLPPEVARGVTVHVLGLTITPGHLGVGARVVVTQLAQ